MALQRKKRTNINGIEGLIQIDEYLDILNTFGIPTSASDSLDAESLLPFKLIFNTTLNRLRIFNTTSELWQDAINADLSQFYTKSEIDLLFSDVTVELTRLNGLKLEANTATSTIYLKDGDDNILSTLNVGFLNNEGSTFFYNPTTSTLDLINDELTILSSIPVSSFISNLASQINFNGILSNRLELKDSSNNILSYVDITINNISGLQNVLDNKEPLITILPITKGGTGKNSITENTFYVGGPLNTLNEKTLQEVFDLLLASGNGINFNNNIISVTSVDNDRLIVTPNGIDLPQIAITPGTYSKVTVDAYGRVIGVTNLTLNDLSPRLNTIANTSSIGIITIDNNGIINIRSIQGTSGRINIYDGSMTLGNTIIDLVPTSVTPGVYKGFEIDQYGRVLSVTQIEPINSEIILFRKGSNSTSINIEMNDICTWISPSGECKFVKYINYTSDNNTQNIDNYIEGISMF